MVDAPGPTRARENEVESYVTVDMVLDSKQVDTSVAAAKPIVFEFSAITNWKKYVKSRNYLCE